METQIIQILVQGGLASVALVSLFLGYRLVANHLDHLNDSLIDLANVITELKQLLEDKLK